MMTEQQMQQLSRDVALKYRVDATRRYIVNGDDITIYLHSDSARCFELQNENIIGTKHIVDYKTGEFFCVESFFYGQHNSIIEDYADHNNNKLLAARIAILRALLEKAE